jgi:hypothetical protein
MNIVARSESATERPIVLFSDYLPGVGSWGKNTLESGI